MSDRRSIPAVDSLLHTSQAAELIAIYGRSLALDGIRSVLAELRGEVQGGMAVPDATAILDLASQKISNWLNPSLIPVINATGVILHTNLGRAPLSQAALQAVAQISAGYSTLEYDLERGQRGTRALHAENLLLRLTGAEAALVVNNNAGAVLLALSALASRRRVVISRTQLVEIGGGFRVPDVMRQSGARLVEVGTTNRVHASDFESALSEPAALVLRAHHSNFKLVGFTSELSFTELVEIAHRFHVPILDDLGSGALLDTARFGLGHEPTVQESLQAGADLVCFSGDKLLGGPQAGIIVGRRDLLARIKKHPLARALRADKICLAALSATLLAYLKGEAEFSLPVWQMIALSPATVGERARRWVAALQSGEVILGQSTVGGGSLPEESLPTFLLSLAVPQPNRFLARLRKVNPPIIARIENERVVFDPRTVLAFQEDAFLKGLRQVLTNDQ
jgi:L-seryl-tRNA(Ser) seleniumtransferase